ncbi:Putative membrane protein YfcA [Campylobacter jejuni subsp. doylei]|uniref:Membrane protein YfcA n=1 Tax=Campylobacter jejuni subsp. doylei TaxID=32021 RepID=A0A3S4SDQ1_CAMJU|nr:Putative membrane protein YfcA [Campylobacter jejuni subsp. doylei]
MIFLTLTFLYTALCPNLGKHESEPKIKNIKIFHLICGLTLGFYDGFLGPGTGSFWILNDTKRYSWKTLDINIKTLRKWKKDRPKVYKLLMIGLQAETLLQKLKNECKELEDLLK